MAPAPATAELRPAMVAGVVEAIALLDAGALFVSGWSRNHPEPGAAVSVVTARGSHSGAFWPLWSDRADVGVGNSFAGIVSLTGELDPGEIGFVRLPDTQLLAIYEKVTQLAAPQASALLRQALAGRPDDITRRTLAPYSTQYDGSDTVNSSPLPIRMGIDDCVALAGGHLLLRGWLFDPERLVGSVALVADAHRQRLDSDWIGQQRRDVTRAMADDARLGSYALAHDVHGFSVIAQSGGETPAHVTLETDGETLHLPLTSRRGNAVSLLRGFVAGLDPDAPGTQAILAKQVVPALLGAALPPAPVLTRLEGEAASDGLCLIIGCAGDCADIPALLHLLAARPDAALLPITIAADHRELSAHADEIAARAGFLGLRLQLAFCDHVEDELDALTAAAAAVTSTVLMLTTARHLPDLVAARDAASRLAAGGPGALLVTSATPPDIDPSHLALVAGRTDFLAAGGFFARRLTVSGKWATVATRLASVLGDAPARLAIATSTDDPPTPAEQLLLRVDRLAARAEAGAADA